MADPSPLFVQFPQVVSPPAVENMPVGSEPVRMSCIFTLSPRPLTISPFSVKAVSLVMLAFSECRSSTLLPTITPLALCHGPLPMRSRALMPASPPGIVVLRYARQFVCVEPVAWPEPRNVHQHPQVHRGPRRCLCPRLTRKRS